MLNDMNLLGAVTAVAFFISAILVFIFRLLNEPRFERWLGYFEYLLAVPLLVMLFTAAPLKRPILYFVQVGLLLAWLALEALLDSLLKIEFRKVRWMVIVYVTLFFAACGGMVGVAAQAGPAWSFAAIGLFLITGVLAFVQRAVTGK